MSYHFELDAAGMWCASKAPTYSNVPTSATVPVVCSRSSSAVASSLLQRILRNRDIAVLLLMLMIFKVSFVISPIKFIISWSGIINKA